MFTPLTYPQAVEPLVRFVEDTEPRDVVASTCRKLNEDVDASDLLLASTLAVTRSCDMPLVHHGGAVHVNSAAYAVCRMTARLSGPYRYLPLIQNVSLSNQHIHSLATGPYILAEFEPRMSDLSVQETLEALEKHAKIGEYTHCDHYSLELLARLPPTEFMDHLLQIAIAKNRFDDHHLLFLAFTWRLLDELGWDCARFLIRPVVRFLTRLPAPPETLESDEVIAEYGLLEAGVRLSSGDDETDAVTGLCMAIGHLRDFSRLPAMLARALADGVSLEGVGEALSVGASLLFLKCQTYRAMDVHLNIAANIQRFLISQTALPLRTKLGALMVWHRGPDVWTSQKYLFESLSWPGTFAERTGSSLLEEMDQLFIAVGADRDSGTEQRIDQLILLAFQYASRGLEAEPLLELVAQHACRDQSSEMHTYEHHQAVYEEYHTTRPSLRWVHLVAAVKGVAISVNPEQRIFRRACQSLCTS